VEEAVSHGLAYQDDELANKVCSYTAVPTMAPTLVVDWVATSRHTQGHILHQLPLQIKV